MSPHPTPSSTSRTAAQSPRGEVARRQRLEQPLVLREQVLERVDQPRSALRDGGGVIPLNGEAQTAQRVQRIRLTDLEHGLRAVDPVHLQSWEPGLLLAPEAQLHGGQPLHQTRDQRLLSLPASSRGRAPEAVELRLQAGAQLTHVASLSPQGVERMPGRRRGEGRSAGCRGRGRGHGPVGRGPACDRRL